MKNECDFSNGVRGKFYNAEAEFNLPIFFGKTKNKFVKKWTVNKSGAASRRSTFKKIK